MAGWASSVPSVIDALLVRFAAAPELVGAEVRDGPGVSKADVMEIVSVGWTGIDGELDADSQLAHEGLGSSPDREISTVRCAAAVLNGSADMGAARRRAYQLVAGAGAALAREHTLNGACMRAIVGSTSLSQAQISNGAQAVVVFEVNVDAFTGR